MSLCWLYILFYPYYNWFCKSPLLVNSPTCWLSKKQWVKDFPVANHGLLENCPIRNHFPSYKSPYSCRIGDFHSFPSGPACLMTPEETISRTTTRTQSPMRRGAEVAISASSRPGKWQKPWVDEQKWGTEATIFGIFGITVHSDRLMTFYHTHKGSTMCIQEG